jgi:hypothetical protein
VCVYPLTKSLIPQLSERDPITSDPEQRERGKGEAGREEKRVGKVKIEEASSDCHQPG